MRLLLIGIFSSLIISCNNSNESIVGKWKMEGCEESFIECPDIITFNEDSTYKVFNDCYGADTNNPIVETGNWESTSDSLILKNRNFETNHYLFNLSTDSVVLFYRDIENIMSLSKKTEKGILKLCFSRKL